MANEYPFDEQSRKPAHKLIRRDLANIFSSKFYKSSGLKEKYRTGGMNKSFCERGPADVQVSVLGRSGTTERVAVADQSKGDHFRDMGFIRWQQPPMAMPVNISK
jgi:hypothetical protein